MKVSVVIPAYNEEKYIGRCLESLMNQEVKADEIVVVNNNSTDKTVSIAKKFPVRILDQAIQGITPTRNLGFDSAKYDIIARTDADSILPTNWIKVIKEELKDKSIIALTGPAILFDAPIPQLTTDIQTKLFFGGSRMILGHETTYGPNTALLKTAWKQIRENVCLDDTKVHEDMDLSIHLSKIGTIKFVPRMVNSVSARRINSNFSSIATDYTFRFVQTLLNESLHNFESRFPFTLKINKPKHRSHNHKR